MMRKKGRVRTEGDLRIVSGRVDGMGILSKGALRVERLLVTVVVK